MVWFYPGQAPNQCPHRRPVDEFGGTRTQMRGYALWIELVSELKAAKQSYYDYDVRGSKSSFEATISVYNDRQGSGTGTWEKHQDP